MITPPFLQNGDCVALASPARSISRKEMEHTRAVFAQNNLYLRVDDAVFKTSNQFAGTDAARIAHFQSLLDDESVKAILCTRGGYGSVRIIDGLDFSVFLNRPKWIAGYSDITVFHAHLQQKLNTESIHASMPINFDNNTINSIDSLFACLNGIAPHYCIDTHQLNRIGESNGKLIGGNLSILYSLLGSRSFPDTTGKILFLEDVDEYLYHIDRMMIGLKRANALKNLAGLVVGGLTNMKDNDTPFGRPAEEIIFDHVKEYSFPVCFGFPAGHLSDNRALIMGRETSLHIQAGRNVELKQHG